MPNESIIFSFPQIIVPDAAPISLNTTSYSASTILLEWEGVPRSAMNGQPLGYKITTNLNGTVVQENEVDFLDSYHLVGNLIPDSQYLFEVCAFNSLGIGPCDRIIGSTSKSRKFQLVLP